MKTHGNRSILACCLVFVALLVALPSHASEGNYYSFSVGAGVASDAEFTFEGDPKEDVELDTGLVLGAAFGRGFGNYRVEGEIGYQKNDLGKIKSGPDAGDEPNGDVSSLSLMCNGYYDFENLTQGGFTPYVSVGVGAVQLDVSLEDGSDKDIVFAWQVGAGVERSLNDTMFLDIFYRYFDPLKGSFTIDDDSLDVDTASHNFMVQLRIMTN